LNRGSDAQLVTRRTYFAPAGNSKETNIPNARMQNDKHATDSDAPSCHTYVLVVGFSTKHCAEPRFTRDARTWEATNIWAHAARVNALELQNNHTRALM
jgi:hypothetical protein